MLIPLGSALLLTGCAGTETEFECNATTSDTCMTMEQANEKAKAKEESASAKPAAAGLLRLADGNFRTTSPGSYPLPPQPGFVKTKSASVAPVNKSNSGLLNNTAAGSQTGLYREYGYAVSASGNGINPDFTADGTRPISASPEKGGTDNVVWVAPLYPTPMMFITSRRRFYLLSHHRHGVQVPH
nr:conjugal transfer protein TraV [Raoultella sp. NCTC 9187]